ncbi:MAG: alpha/beta hydrolase domain-containing protein [Bryobacteraceae bacterium]
MLRKAVLFFLTLSLASAAVTRVDIAHRSDMAGNYERITGKVYFAVDPALAANRIITDIGLAPRNEKGLVEFSADLEVLRPKAKGNGTALVEISNRGGNGMVNMFDVGDSLLFEQGFTMVWIGWEFDIPDREGALKLYAPVIKGITGVVRSEIVVDKESKSESLGDRAQIPYAVADAASATLTVRDGANAKRTTIARDRWKFSSDLTHVEYTFEPGRIYEVVYTGKDPAVVGLGPAAIRDYVSYLKQQGQAERAIGFGVSQSGRFLRTFLYYGFNADENGKRVFDGVWAHVAGAGRGSFDHRFAQPSRDGHPRLNLMYPSDIFPFTDEPETDGGITDSILARARKDGVVPKIFYSNGAYEYWGRAASLIHISPDGKQDVAPAAETRVYFIAGAQHGANAKPVRTVTQNLANPTDYRFAMRALLVDLNGWVTNGTAPPDSKMPRIGKDELVVPGALNFPKVPGIALPKEPYLAWHLDFGPDFKSKGLVAYDPPKVGAAFPVLVPQVNADGNETAGIRLPEQMVPLATYTGWNLRDPKIGAPDVIYNMVGSFIPFARTKAERERSGDPRLSIEERYKDKEEYLRQVREAAVALTGSGFLLKEDVEKVGAKAAERWDSIMK